tara:strand:- start:8399 stop:9511 length:1113 start_codon:yes stop_codon:yes gene_type:complete
MKKNITFICGASDFHSIDWYRTVKKINLKKRVKVNVVTDEYSPHKLDNLLNESDNIFFLLNIGKLTSTTSNSFFSDFFRNLIKLFIIPIQAYKLNKLSKKLNNNVFHAHSMYYIFLSWLSGVEYIATPMGSDILVRPDKSLIYKYFCIRSLKSANKITVDSKRMFNKILNISNRKSYIVQNGVDISEIQSFKKFDYKRNKFTSIRALYPNYRINELILNRNISSNPNLGINFLYPFFEISYKESILKCFNINDVNLGRLSKKNLYKTLWKSKIVFSVPESDSSPRSVYESIFSGCVIITSPAEWIDDVTECMKNRIIIADLNKHHWFDNALQRALEISKIKYDPSQKAYDIFDQFSSMKMMSKNIYEIYD